MRARVLISFSGTFNSAFSVLRFLFPAIITLPTLAIIFCTRRLLCFATFSYSSRPTVRLRAFFNGALGNLHVIT